jgi:hypothetical protein
MSVSKPLLLGVKISLRGISNLITDPAAQWFPPAVDPNADLSPPPDDTKDANGPGGWDHQHVIPGRHNDPKQHRQRASYNVAPHGVEIEPGVSSLLKDVPDFDRLFEGGGGRGSVFHAALTLFHALCIPYKSNLGVTHSLKPPGFNNP